MIGAYADATGEVQAFGSFEEEGWAIAEAHLNEDGGILGRPVESRFEGTGSDKDQARSIMEEPGRSNGVRGVGPRSPAVGGRSLTAPEEKA